MAKNRIVYVSHFRGMVQNTVTVTRDTYRKQYLHPTKASVQRLCAVVSAQVHQGKMALWLWPEGFWANSLSERM